jgi:Gpi18-like mannosyltransferase
VIFIVLSCLLVIFHSTAELDLFHNGLTGTIPSEVGLMSNLGESSIVWLLVVMIVLSCVLHCNLMVAFVIFSILQLTCLSTTIV